MAVRDEEDMLPGCLTSLDFVDEIVVVVDDRTIDATDDVAREFGATVHRVAFEDFASFKNRGIDLATGDWILIIDGDERIPPSLAVEIRRVTGGSHDAFEIGTANYFFGSRMKWGGWRGDYHPRLFRRGSARYVGDIHEQLDFHMAGPSIQRLDEPIVHFTHRSIRHNLAKTLEWSDLQAQEMLRSGHPAMTPTRLFMVVLREFWHRFVRNRGWRDGMPGVIECIYQPFSLFVIHVRLWELQRRPSLEASYQLLESELREPSG